MKRTIRLSESDIHRLVIESVNVLLSKGYRLLNEEDTSGSGPVSSSLEFEIPEFYEEEISHFRDRLVTLKRKAISAGGDITIDTKIVQGPMKQKQRDEKGNEYTEIVQVNFVHFTITPSTPVIQMPGYKYIGSIVPLSIDIDGIVKESMIVTLSTEFEGNDALRDELKNSSMRMTCDGCHREASRGIYYAFLEESSGRIIKLGSRCASKYFGIEVGDKIKNLFYALSELGNEPYVLYGPDGFPADKVREPRTSSLGNSMSDNERKEFDKMILRGCMAVAEFGPYCRIKDSMTHAIMLEDLYDKALKQSLVWQGGQRRLLESMYRRLIEEMKEQYPKLFEAREAAFKLESEFLRDGAKFFFEMQPTSEFDEKIKNIGLLICGGKIQKKLIGKFNYLNFIPYCVGRFFKDKADKDPANAENVTKPITPFDGVKEMDVTVTNIDKKQTRNGKEYYRITALTGDNEEASWNMFDRVPDFSKGEKLRITAHYNNTYRTLDNVTVTKEKDIPAQEAREQLTYPADGTRYKNDDFEVIKLSKNYLVVRNSNDNCEYYISNVADAFGYYGVTREKFDLTKISEGQHVTLTGTVASYVSQKTGKTGHKLVRVSGLPKPSFNE